MAIESFSAAGYKVWFDPECPGEGFDLVHQRDLSVPRLNLVEVEALRLAAWIVVMVARAKDPGMIRIDRSGGGG